jgi:peptidoglycan/xylan/chitin deacetylase (PgdA/CDA1 family)
MAAAQYLPSTVALGQWTPLRALPGGLCRWRGDGAGVALTFDDGPSPEATPKFLDRLDRLGLTATFFVLGSLTAEAPTLVAEIGRRGHQVETHGYHHRHHLARSPGWVRRDLSAAARAMQAAGLAPRWYRPSYGQATGATLWAARRQGWRTVLWSAWGREWATDDPAEVAARIGRRLRPGAVVLLHDNDRFGRPGMWRTGLEALDRVAEDLDRRGLQAVTLDQLLR